MWQDDPHVSDQDLLRAADGELPARQIATIRKHLAACWMCRTRTGEIEGAIAEFIQAHHRTLDSLLPPPDGARALLKLRMAELAAVSPPNPWRRLFSALLDRRRLTVACCILALIGPGAIVLRFDRFIDESRTTAQRPETRAFPDPNLTPGATLPVSRDDVCAAGMAEAVRLVPAPVALQVFAAYGIREPRPRAYELDYLITPALGGADNIRNFWPQPYGSAWNAHLKDALEDHLHRQVCAGTLDLATAQRDLARDWISSYKKYFRTNKPLPEHASFLKDHPWE
jgi:hypothetical protein